EDLLDPATLHRRRLGGERRVPRSGRTIRALGQPDAPRLAAAIAGVGGAGGARLTFDRRVGAEQREVAVRRAARDDLDRAGIFEPPEAPHHVRTEQSEELLEDRAGEALSV